jgi:hypothetical protein
MVAEFRQLFHVAVTVPHAFQQALNPVITDHQSPRLRWSGRLVRHDDIAAGIDNAGRLAVAGTRREAAVRAHWSHRRHEVERAMVQERVRSLLTVLLVIVGVSVVIGGILAAALFLGASGFGGAGPPASPPLNGADPLATDTNPPSTQQPTEGTTTDPAPTEPDATEDVTEDADTEPTEGPVSGFSLQASPTTVASMEDVTLQGTFDGPDGTVLQVQRRLEGGDWEDFPVEATVRNGTFTTTIRSGRVGTNEFRMRDDTGAVSNVVTVAVQ